MICDKEHRYDPKFDSLPTNQAGAGRHLCAGCAYDKGYQDGKNRVKKRAIGELNLPESQAGDVRHKDVQAAYDLGYQEGSKE